jgi:CDP-diacylglycerol--glycerol-3-phosphate 3-phosphatidyltransferase
MVTSLMVSYTRARAEALIGSCKVGFMERPERVVLIILGALFNRWGVMAPVLWVLAVLSTITVIHRISYTYQRTKPLPVELRNPSAASPAARTGTSDLRPAPRA